MEHEISLPCSELPATGPYPKPHESSPHPATTLSKINSNIIFHLRLDLQSSLFLSDFPTKISFTFFISPIRARCPVHLILHLITLTIPGAKYNLRSYSHLLFLGIKYFS
jgi:hypothetical protein